MVLTGLGYILLFIFITKVSQIIASNFGFGPARPHIGGLRQETRLITNEYSINLRASYMWQGSRKASYINFINPRRGILIMGSPGSGKSRFIIEPTIRQLMEKGFAMFIYDFKFSTLTDYAYGHFLNNRDKYPKSARFFCINFSDLTRSHRCNVIHPGTMDSISDAIGASKTILLGVNKSWVERQGEFFVESPTNFLAALIWYLKKYRKGEFCTLAHVIELSQVPYDELSRY